MDWDQSEGTQEGGAGGAGIVLSLGQAEEFDEFLPVDDPSVLECYDAAEQGNQALEGSDDSQVGDFERQSMSGEAAADSSVERKVRVRRS